MRDDLLRFYDMELAFLRKMGAHFADKYPKIAARLALERNKCEDPHVERLLQGFAFLTARLRLKLDDELPEVTDALLGVLYPHYLAPVPAMSTVQFLPDTTKGKITAGYQIPAGTVLLSRPVQGEPCKFRTGYPVTLWPLELITAELRNAPFDGIKLPPGVGDPQSLLRLVLRTPPKVPISGMKLDRLRFYLDGSPTLVHPLYELMLNNPLGVVLRPHEDQKLPPLRLPGSVVTPVGFSRDEGLLPYPPRSFVGYRLLQEYFTFPDKFLYVDVSGLEIAGANGYSDTLEILLLLPRKNADLEKNLTVENFRMHCTPVVNLFEQTAEPIRVKQTRTEHHVIPDVRRPMALEVYSVESVLGVAGQNKPAVDFLPFYSFKHSYERQKNQAFWYSLRRPSGYRDDPGTEVYLTLVDLDKRPVVPENDVLAVRTVCSNRDLPGKLPFTGPGVFNYEIGGPPAAIRCLRQPTATVRVSTGQAAQWRLISHLSLNYLSLTDRDALREILALYDFSDLPSIRKQINGLVGLSSKPAVGRTGPGAAAGFCRGLEITVEFDEENYVGSGIYLFASVLERFFGLYTSINSFTRLTARSKQREGDIRRWAPRAGEINLL